MGRPKGATAGKRKQKKEKDPNKPKRPTSAYFYFIADERKKNEAAGKKITKVAEWTKEVSAIWRDMSDSEKEPFDKLAAKDKARYDSQMANYKGTKGSDPDKPKRPMSAYFLWLGDFRKENKGEYSENKELLKAAGAEWKKLSSAEKKPYEQKAAAEKSKYEQTMKDYHQKGGGASKAKKQKVANGADDDDDEDDEDDEEEEDEEEEDEEEDEDSDE